MHRFYTLGLLVVATLLGVSPLAQAGDFDPMDQHDSFAVAPDPGLASDAVPAPLPATYALGRATAPAERAPWMPPATSRDLVRIEQHALAVINERRAELGLAALRPEPRVTALAREHSANMAAGRQPFGHDGFYDRMARSGYGPDAAENVTWNAQPASRAGAHAVESWLESPRNREHLEGDRLVTGVGAARDADGRVYVTQLFFKG